MKTFVYIYFVNTQEDPDGRYTGYEYGYREGDELTLAWVGPVKAVDEDHACDTLYNMFNNPDKRPTDYRGPSASKGSVFVLDGKAYALQMPCYVRVNIESSNIQQVAPWAPTSINAPKGIR
jgi:hypothetical protein